MSSRNLTSNLIVYTIAGFLRKVMSALMPKVKGRVDDKRKKVRDVIVATKVAESMSDYLLGGKRMGHM